MDFDTRRIVLRGLLLYIHQGVYVGGCEGDRQLRNMACRSKKRQPFLAMPMGSTGTILHTQPKSVGSNDSVTR